MTNRYPPQSVVFDLTTYEYTSYNHLRIDRLIRSGYLVKMPSKSRAFTLTYAAYDLLDESKRKRDTEGTAYAIDPAEVRDMMRRYDVMSITKIES